jgi:hypothetical protein
VDGRTTIHSLGKGSLGAGHDIQDVALLGSDAKTVWEQTADGLHVQLGNTPSGKYAYVLRVRMN